MTVQDWWSLVALGYFALGVAAWLRSDALLRQAEKVARDAVEREARTNALIVAANDMLDEFCVTWEYGAHEEARDVLMKRIAACAAAEGGTECPPNERGGS